jgi:hypothetical protein
VAGEQGMNGAFERFPDAIRDGLHVAATGRTVASRSAGAERITDFSPAAVIGGCRSDATSGLAVAGDGGGS